MFRYAWILALLLAPAASAQNVKWTFKTTGMPQAPTLYPDAVRPTGVLVAADQQVFLLSGKGELQWTASFDKLVANLPTAADIDGDGSSEILVSLIEASIVCLDASGNVRWTRALPSAAHGFGLTVVADVHAEPGLEILAGRQDGWLYCLSASGEVLWRFFGDKFRIGNPAAGDVDGDGCIEIVYGTDNGHVYCLNGNGQLDWACFEQAPYGRSGVNLADLDGDGKVEVLLTRSNQGNATCLMALDGATGEFKWRTRDQMQSYTSNVTADLDGDGKLETLHGDKGNWLYCTNADGVERWRLELAGRGIFWAPAVADVNGDGALEIVVPIRNTDPVTGACYFLVSADGKVLAPLKIGGSGNAAPAIGDLDGDGALEVLLATQSPDAVQALTWGGGGKVAWACLRGDSAMAARANVPEGKPCPALEASGPALTADMTEVFAGANVLHASWEQATPEHACAEIAVRRPEGAGETRITALPGGVREADLAWEMPGAGQATCTIRILAPGVAGVLAAAQRNVQTNPPDACDFEGVEAACNQAIAAASFESASGLETRRIALEAARRSLQRLAQSPHNDSVLAAQATALRKQAGELRDIANALQAFWKQKNGGSFVCRQDPNPWDPFDPLAMPEALEANPPVKIIAFGDEFEDAALNLLNISNHAIDVRCVFSKPKLAGGTPDPEPELANYISLRRGLAVPAYNSPMILDVLPELDRSRCIRLAPFETAQLWLVIDTHGLEAGIHQLTLYLGSMEPEMTLRELPITIEVLPVRLPEGVYAQMNWVGINPRETSDQQLKDMIDHGISVTYGPVLPTLSVDADGNLAGAIDWSATDAGLARVPGYFQLLFPSPPTVNWPEGVKAEPDSALSDKGFATAVRALAEHLAEKGFGYERWAFYPMDEPWLTGLSNIPSLRKFCERVKAADPSARNYADPTGMLRVEYVQEFKDLIDIWQPEINILKRDRPLREWFQQNARTLWAYEATDPSKDLLPLGYYRGYGWLAWHLGLKGAGFWCYKAFDDWWPMQTTDWSVVYQTNDEVTPSRRWEACRDGQEDYRMLYALRGAIEKARAAGRVQEAAEAQSLLDSAVEDVIAWQARSIDEITRQTRDYELDYGTLMRYRQRIAERLVALSSLN